MPPSSPAAAAWTEKDGLLVEGRLASLRLRHGFTTKRLGEMKDKSRRGGAAALLGLPAPLTLHQVHGTRIRLASEGASADGAEGDGWIVDAKGVSVAVHVADCVPLFVWADDGAVAGVFHAGWRGTARGMPKAAVAEFARLGVPAARLSAALGPHAGGCCYRVGPELRKDFPESSFISRQDGLYLDLGAEHRRQLAEAGLSPAKVGAPAPCTICGEDYFSFRRDKQVSRMLAILSLDLWPS